MTKFDFEYYEVKLLERIKETKDVYTFRFEKPDTTWNEGTNVHIAFHDFMDKDPKDKTYVRHLSIMNLSDQPYMGFTTRIAEHPSPFKKRLKKLKIGEGMIVYKLSQRMTLRREEKPIVLISMGVGISAMKPIIETYALNSKNIPSMTSINISSGEFIYYEYLNQFTETNHVFVTSRKKLYEVVASTYRKDNIYYLVGSDQFLEDMIEILIEKGHDTDNIEIDKKQNKKDKMLKATNH